MQITSQLSSLWQHFARTQWLKIQQKVSFCYFASEASKVYFWLKKVKWDIFGLFSNSVHNCFLKLLSKQKTFYMTFLIEKKECWQIVQINLWTAIATWHFPFRSESQKSIFAYGLTIDEPMKVSSWFGICWSAIDIHTIA